MKAAWYDTQGAAHDVLVIGDMPAPQPGAGEVRIRISASGINPGDLKKRADAFGIGMTYPRVIPHSDGAGVIDAVGAGVSADRIGERVWCHGAQSHRAFGTAAQFVAVPEHQAIRLPDPVCFDIGACLGIPGITAHRSIHAGGPVVDRTVLVQGGAGAVGAFAVGLARRAGGRVIATVRSTADEEVAMRAGAHHVIRMDARSTSEIVADILRYAPDGVHHVVEVAFDANIDIDMQVLAVGGSIAAYATHAPRPAIPFWELLFKNARLLLLGSDDFPVAAKIEAAAAVTDLVASGWPGLVIDKTFALSGIAEAHVYAEGKHAPGRVVLIV
jgi:NADPH2:quinone reductase